MTSRTMVEQEQRNYVRDLLFVLFAYWRTAKVAFALVLTIAVGVLVFAPSQYLATGSFLVKGKRAESAPGALEKPELRIQPLTKEDLFSEVAILTSEEVLLPVVVSLRHEGLLPGKSGIPEAELDNNYRLMIARSLKTQVAPSSNVIDVSLRWRDPKVAYRIMSGVMSRYLLYRRQMMMPKEMEKFFSMQLQGYQKALDEKDRELMELAKTSRSADDQTEIQNNQAMLARLDDQIGQQEAERLDRAQRIAQIEAALAAKDDQYFSFIDNPTIRDLSGKLGDLTIQRAKVMKSFLPGSPPATEANQQMEMVSEQLRQEVGSYLSARKGELAALDEQLTMLKNRRQALVDRNLQLRQAAITFARLTQERALIAYSYDTFYKRHEEALSNQTEGNMGLQNYVAVLHAAKVEPLPVFPDPRRVVPIGLAISVLAAASAALLAHFFDATIRRPEDVEYNDIPVLFSIFEQGTATVSTDKRIQWRWIGLFLLLALGVLWSVGPGRPAPFFARHEMLTDLSMPPANLVEPTAPKEEPSAPAKTEPRADAPSVAGPPTTSEPAASAPAGKPEAAKAESHAEVPSAGTPTTSEPAASAPAGKPEASKAESHAEVPSAASPPTTSEPAASAPAGKPEAAKAESHPEVPSAAGSPMSEPVALTPAAKPDAAKTEPRAEGPSAASPPMSEPVALTPAAKPDAPKAEPVPSAAGPATSEPAASASAGKPHASTAPLLMPRFHDGVDVPAAAKGW